MKRWSSQDLDPTRIQRGLEPPILCVLDIRQILYSFDTGLIISCNITGLEITIVTLSSWNWFDNNASFEMNSCNSWLFYIHRFNVDCMLDMHFQLLSGTEHFLCRHIHSRYSSPVMAENQTFLKSPTRYPIPFHQIWWYRCHVNQVQCCITRSVSHH